MRLRRLKHLRDEAFYLRKKKVSCGHCPHSEALLH